MKNSLKLNHSLKHTFKFSKNTQDQLKLLGMNRQKISELLKDIAKTNPFLEYTTNEEFDSYLDTQSSKPSLQDELFYQLHTCSSQYSDKISKFIIESLDENGFFTSDISDSCSYLHTSRNEFIKNLELIQSFEPCGVAATSHSNCLIIQLCHMGYLDAAYLLKHYSLDIENGKLDHIKECMNIDSETLQILFEQIRMCNPYPCSEYSSFPTEVIIPEFEIIIDHNELIVEPKSIGKLSVHDSHIKELSKEAKEYLNQAKFYVDSINKRNKTLLILVNELLTIQKDHFLYQSELNACTLQDIAKNTNYSISTVSRILSNKYYLFQDKIYPVKDLFISKTKQGTSKDVLLKEIQSIIESEDKTKPFSDDKIVQLLKKQGLFISRRTISKYRSILNIKSSSQRKIN